MIYDFFQGDFSVTATEDCEQLAKLLKDTYTPKKKDAIYVSKLYKNMGFMFGDKRSLKIAEKMYQCGNFLVFKKEGEKRKLVYINSCKARFCPMCAWRKSLKIYSETIQVTEYMQRQRPSSKFIFLTLTQRNVEYAGLKDEIEKIIKGLRNLLRVKEIRAVTLGTMRNIEITYNVQTQEWHPHVHMILHVTSLYAQGGQYGAYIHQPRWVYLWQRAMNLDYAPNVDVRMLKPSKKGNHRELAEIAKYAVKPSAITDDYRNIAILEGALFHKRLLSYTGTFKEARQILKLKDNLTDEDTFVQEDDGVYELYQWHFGKQEYERTSRFTL